MWTRTAGTYTTRPDVLTLLHTLLLTLLQGRYVDAHREYLHALHLAPQHPTVAANLALLRRALAVNNNNNI